MDFVLTVIKNPFTWGLVIGLVLAALSVFSHWKTARELKRLKGHLSDKLEIEAEKMASMKGEIEDLKGENENLRLKISSGRVQDDKQDLERELEIFARAEKSMTLNAPGFAQAWEKAKEGALDELTEEERGKSLPRRIFRKYFKKSDGTTEVVEALPEESSINEA
ncbi:MAG: hypothetical protein AAF226_10900 [Verrucomicrobiota bacterium]